jgi:ATP-dependent Clp protease ATP-binding subunit ClpA
MFDIEGIEKALEIYICAEVPKSCLDGMENINSGFFNEAAYGLLLNALKLAGNMSYDKLIPSHLFLAFLDDREGFGNRVLINCISNTESIKSLKNIQVNLERMLKKGPNCSGSLLAPNKKYLSESILKVIENALIKSVQAGLTQITPKKLLFSLMTMGGEIFFSHLTMLKIKPEEVIEISEGLNEDEKLEIVLPFDLDNASVLKGDVQVYCREAELAQIFKVLYRDNNRNIIIYGDKGVGKTFIASAIEIEIAQVKPRAKFLKNYPCIYFDFSDTMPEEAMDKARKIFSYMEENHKRVYIIDNFYKLYSVCPDFCKQKLRKNKFYFIAIISSNDYSDLNRSGELLNDYFEFIELVEPSKNAAIKILELQAKVLEEKYNAVFEVGLIEKTVKLAKDFLIAEHYPSKAIRLLTKACEEASYEKKQMGDKENCIVTSIHIANQISTITKLPTNVILGLGEDINYYDLLSQSVKGQERAVMKVADKLDMINSGFVNKALPPAVFMFIGLSGTGKTELANEISKVYSAKRSLIQFAMENYKESHNVSGLIGTSAGFVGYEEGGKLIKDLNNDPYSVVLFDEIEKAHPAVWDPILQLFDKGDITDLKGTTAYGNKAFFIMTSNIGYKTVCKMLRNNSPIEEIEKSILKELYEAKHPSGELCFRPEFLGRIMRLGGIVVFNPLSYEAIREITYNVVKKHCEEWSTTRGNQLIVDQEVIDFIARRCFDENEQDISDLYVEDWRSRKEGSQNESVRYKGGRIIFSSVDDLILKNLQKRLKECSNAKVVRVSKNNDSIDILWDSVGEISGKELLQNKVRIADEIIGNLEKLILKDSSLQSLTFDELEKINMDLKKIYGVINK